MSDRNDHSDFWHAQVSVIPLCLYRCGFGLLLCAEAISWLPYTKELFSSEGFHLSRLAPLAPDPIFAFLLCLLLVVTTFCIAMGFLTKFSISLSLILWIFFFMLDHINEKALHSLVIAIMVILLCSPSQARYSLDDWFRKRRQQKRLPDQMCIFPQRLLQMVFVQSYLGAGLVKISSSSWVSGRVLGEILTSRWATDVGVWISGWMPVFGFQWISVSIIMYELMGGIFLFIPALRPFVICFGVAFHVGISLTLQVGFLGWHFIWALLILFSEDFARAIERVINTIKNVLFPNFFN